MLKSFPWCATWIFCKCDTIKKKAKPFVIRNLRRSITIQCNVFFSTNANILSRGVPSYPDPSRLTMQWFIDNLQPQTLPNDRSRRPDRQFHAAYLPPTGRSHKMALQSENVFGVLSKSCLNEASKFIFDFV